MSPYVLVALVLAVGAALYWTGGPGGRRVARRVASRIDGWVEETLAGLSAAERAPDALPVATLRFERRDREVTLTIDARVGTSRRTVRRTIDWADAPEAVRARFLSGEHEVVIDWTRSARVEV